MNGPSTFARVAAEGSAKHGADHWWRQRLTGLALVPLTAWFAVSLLIIPRFDQPTLAGWMSRGRNAIPFLGLVLVIAYHSYLGLRAVVDDYVHNPQLRILTLLLIQVAHWILAAVGAFAIVKIADVALGGTL